MVPVIEVPAPAEKKSPKKIDPNLQQMMKRRIYFPATANGLQIDYSTSLDQVSKLIKDNPDFKIMQIEVYTDNQGSRDSNVFLSEKVVESVQKYLVKSGVSPQRLTTKAYGKNMLFETNASKTKVHNPWVEFSAIEYE